MKTPILDGLKRLKEENSISFHMPGHKGKNTLIKWGDYIPYIDTTEVNGMDNLHDPRGIIRESQELAAKTFGAKETLSSINGTTGGIYIALSTVTSPGDKILIQRNSHKSMYNGAILNRLNVEYIYPNYNEKYHVLTGIDPEDIEAKLKEDKDIKVVTIVYPNYYGVCSDLKRIAEIVHKYDRILLVDEAHGSHFTFSNKFPISALQAGADIVVQSTHKTLPSFTQTSMVHIGTDRVDIDKLRDMSSLYQTTSPSYLFMASLEIARAYMEGEGKEKLEESVLIIDEAIKTLEKIDRVHVFTGDDEDKTIYAKDNTKILIRLDNMTGTKLENILMRDYNIRLEMSDYYYALVLTSLMNEKEDFEKLINALEHMAKNSPYEEVIPVSIKMPTPKVILPIYTAFYGSKKVIDLKNSIGKISASYVIPYPPGIPLICPGEEITDKIVEHIWFLMDKGIEIVGLMGYNKEKIEVVD